MLWTPGSLSYYFLNHIFGHLVPGDVTNPEKWNLEEQWLADSKTTEELRSPLMWSVLENGRVATRDEPWWCNPEGLTLQRGQRRPPRSLPCMPLKSGMTELLPLCSYSV